MLPAPADYDLFLVLNAFEIDSQRQRGIPLHTYAQVFEHRHLLPLVVERPTANQLLGSLQDVTFPRTVRVRSEDLAGSRISPVQVCWHPQLREAHQQLETTGSALAFNGNVLRTLLRTRKHDKTSLTQNLGSPQGVRHAHLALRLNDPRRHGIQKCCKEEPGQR